MKSFFHFTCSHAHVSQTTVTRDGNFKVEGRTGSHLVTENLISFLVKNFAATNVLYKKG